MLLNNGSSNSEAGQVGILEIVAVCGALFLVFVALNIIGGYFTPLGDLLRTIYNMVGSFISSGMSGV